jgi:hypothetical protein
MHRLLPTLGSLKLHFLPSVMTVHGNCIRLSHQWHVVPAQHMWRDLHCPRAG